jgi:hypothetical protein
LKHVDRVARRGDPALTQLGDRHRIVAVLLEQLEQLEQPRGVSAYGERLGVASMGYTLLVHAGDSVPGARVIGHHIVLVIDPRISVVRPASLFEAAARDQLADRRAAEK